MNREFIEKAQVGWVLDAMVAECVLGWTPWFEKRGDYTHFIWQKAGEREPYKISRNWEAEMSRYTKTTYAEFDRMKHVEHGLPKFSKDMADAWQVVKEMNAKNYWFGCQVLSSKCQAWFSENPNNKVDAVASTFDLPLAICRAALLTKVET